MKTGERPYVMTARAASAEQTAERILDAAIDLFWEEPTTALSLEQVAERAGVATRTVIRRFGGRDGLLRAAGERQMAVVAAERSAPVGDPAAAVRALVGHYERVGDGVTRLLAVEGAEPGLAIIAEQGRQLHRQWCRTTFAPTLAGLTGIDRKRRLAQLVAICDLNTWQLLRRDAGLSRAQTERALLEMLQPLLED